MISVTSPNMLQKAWNGVRPELRVGFRASWRRIIIKKNEFFLKKVCKVQFYSYLCNPIRGNSSVGRAQPCQGWGREFESRFPLQESAEMLTFFLKTLPDEVSIYSVVLFRRRLFCLYIGSTENPGCFAFPSTKSHLFMDRSMKWRLLSIKRAVSVDRIAQSRHSERTANLFPRGGRPLLIIEIYQPTFSVDPKKIQDFALSPPQTSDNSGH